MVEFAFLAFIIVLVLISFGRNNKLSKENARIWSEFAARHESELEPQTSFFHRGTAVGTIHFRAAGREFTALGYAKSHGDSALPASKLTCKIDNDRNAVYIAPSLGRFVQHRRAPRIETGYPDIDARCEIYTMHEIWTKRAIASSEFLRERLLESNKDLHIELADGLLYVERTTRIQEADELDALLELALEVAEVFENTEMPKLGHQSIGGLSIAEAEANEGALTVASAPAGSLSDTAEDGREE